MNKKITITLAKSQCEEIESILIEAMKRIGLHEELASKLDWINSLIPKDFPKKLCDEN